ncbi:proton-coupled amino acid transporter-like protein CG1139 [Drosophila rhopaloa]|uniref:Amino acid transporter transmembrane domain-containing protein n=1 Tax=Drosophila rhopaloa TaxID=1041015 RepID=A0ABM5H9H3_DRORH|nr:proton-coupled amino acid transporter-like protein CG1139 [Drosophila rhopaloa]
MNADIKTVTVYPTTLELTTPTKPANGSNDDYDPHQHRNVKNPTTNWQTFAHFLKASVGTGVLAMPSAFANAGYVNGTILTLIIGSLALYCLHILISCMYTLCKRQRVPYVSFSQAMNLGLKQGPPWLRCLAPISIPFVDGFLAFYHFGICCVYVVFIAESIKQLVDEWSGVQWDVRIYMCIIIVPLLLIYSIKNLKLLAPFSSAANLLLLVGFGIILYYIFEDLPPLSEREPFVAVTKLPTFFGTVLFALEAVGVILAIEENMATPRAFVRPCGIMNGGMSIVLGLYVLLGFFGYWKYGEEALGSITLNIPQSDIPAQVVKVFFAITTWISYALQGYVTAHILWSKYLSKHFKETRQTLYELIFRAIIVLLTFACAVAIPDLSVFLSLVGSFCLSILGLIFPALLQICVQYTEGYGPLRIKLIINLLLLCFGVFGGVVGTYVSIVDIIEVYK